MKKNIKRIISHPLFSGSAIMIVGSTSTNFINYIYHLILGRMLGPASYGSLASILSLIGMIGIIPSSLGLVVTKQVSSVKSSEEVDSFLSYINQKIYFLGLIIFFLILATSPLLTKFLNLGQELLLVLSATTFIFSLPSLFNRSSLQGLMKFKEMVVSILIENSSRLFLGIVFVALGFSVVGATWGLVIAAALGWISGFYSLKNHLKKHKAVKPDIKALINYAIPVLFQGLAINSLYSSDLLLVKHYFSDVDSGLYASLSFLGKIIFFGAAPITQVMFPLVSRRSNSGENYRKIFLLSLLGTVLLSAGVLIVYLLIPDLIIKISYSSKFLGQGKLLFWMGLVITLVTMCFHLISYFLALNVTKIVYLALVGATLQILGIILFHNSLFQVIFVSLIVCLGLLIVLILKYLSLEQRKIFTK